MEIKTTGLGAGSAHPLQAFVWGQISPLCCNHGHRVPKRTHTCRDTYSARVHTHWCVRSEGGFTSVTQVSQLSKSERTKWAHHLGVKRSSSGTHLCGIPPSRTWGWMNTSPQCCCITHQSPCCLLTSLTELSSPEQMSSSHQVFNISRSSVHTHTHGQVM